MSLTTSFAVFLSNDEHYVTTYNNARELITAFDHDDILKHLIKYYFEN